MERKFFDELMLSIRDVNPEKMLEETKNCQDDEQLQKCLMKNMFNIFVSAFVNSTEIINFRYKSEGEDKRICLICKKVIQNNSLCRKPDCSHLFHATCICSYLNNLPKEQHMCPICFIKLEDKIFL